MRSDEQVDINKGLRQVCPLSQLLFVMYMVRIVKALEGSNIEFDFAYKEADTVVEQQLAGLFYADDIVLLAERNVTCNVLLIYVDRKPRMYRTES